MTAAGAGAGAAAAGARHPHATATAVRAHPAPSATGMGVWRHLSGVTPMPGTLTMTGVAMTGVAMETAGVGVAMTGGMTRMPDGHHHVDAAGEGVLCAGSTKVPAGWGGVCLQDGAG